MNRKENPNEVRHPYSVTAKVLLVGVLAFIALFTCSGCASGWTDNAKTIRFQVPALLDVEFEYNDQKGQSDPKNLREVFADED